MTEDFPHNACPQHSFPTSPPLDQCHSINATKHTEKTQSLAGTIARMPTIAVSRQPKSETSAITLGTLSGQPSQPCPKPGLSPPMRHQPNSAKPCAHLAIPSRGNTLPNCSGNGACATSIDYPDLSTPPSTNPTAPTPSAQKCSSPSID